MVQSRDPAPSLRGPVLSLRGMAASEHPLATQTGVDVMRRGGNAFDAALAMSAVLPVVKPSRSHLGGDAYVLARPRGGAVTAICSGGKAPRNATLERYAGGIPHHGGAAVAVPGLVDAWSEIGARWCSMPLADLLAPAISYARDGFAVSRELALVLRGAEGLFRKYGGLVDALYPGGGPPPYGSRLQQPMLARALDAIAANGRDGFYTGVIAQRIADGVQAAGGWLDTSDLREHRADVLEPLSIDYRGCTVYETPPNSQGLILLEELKILEGYDLQGWGHLSADAVHHMVEAKKLAFEDRERNAGDPALTSFDAGTLISDEHAALRRGEIDPKRARPSAVATPGTDTTSFVVADGDGNVCSFIQSVFTAFGSAVCVDGIIMNNRMTGFSLEPGHPNVLAPGKRTMHTLNTYIVFRDGEPLLAGNTPGADFQVQTNVQVITGVLDYGLDAQAAVDAPRWGHTPAGLQLEPGVPDDTAAQLSRRGHDVQRVERAGNRMGRAQAIVFDQRSGALIGGSDSRGEGLAAGW